MARALREPNKAGGMKMLSFASVLACLSQAHGLRAAPFNATNITVYHVNPLEQGPIPINMDTGDVKGDLYFVMRSVGRPIECAKNPTAEDCTDAEVVSPTLVATKLLVEINPDYGGYGMCNICTPKFNYSNCTMGKYFCLGKYNANKVGTETVASVHPSTCPTGAPDYLCWRNHLVTKIGGQWWSFFNESYCGNGSSNGTCAWRVSTVQKVINNTCLLDRIFTAIEAYPVQASCFANCTTPRRRVGQNSSVVPTRNTSDPCWVRCAMAAVLGPQGGEANGSITGMSLADLEAGWEKAFEEESQGGCPVVATKLFGH